MYRGISPLRYPGGKSFLSKFLVDVIDYNYPIDTYIEPFAGGAGAALALLINNHVKQIILNDADDLIYKFWHVTLNRSKELAEKIKATPINIKEWKKQKAILSNKHADDLDIAFATLFLNRCNRSGIIFTGGPIGGYEQAGTWKVDARFNKENIIDRIKTIAQYKGQIKIYNFDAMQLPLFHRTLI
jgi:DNA adenine methylase